MKLQKYVPKWFLIFSMYITFFGVLQVYQLMKQDSYMRFLKSELYNECLVAEDECRPLPFEDEVDENKKEKVTLYQGNLALYDCF